MHNICQGMLVKENYSKTVGYKAMLIFGCFFLIQQTTVA
jgi:hypothetical protein